MKKSIRSKTTNSLACIKASCHYMKSPIRRRRRNCRTLVVSSIARPHHREEPSMGLKKETRLSRRRTRRKRIRLRVEVLGYRTSIRQSAQLLMGFRFLLISKLCDVRGVIWSARRMDTIRLGICALPTKSCIFIMIKKLLKVNHNKSSF